jgi:pentatricopeptide repeat protein
MAQRSRELDPLALRNSALEGQFLFYAGKYDDSLEKLQKAIEFEPNYWLAHLFITRVYIEKGMYTEAIAGATKARNLSGGANTEVIALIIYALAKSGKIEEARSMMSELKRLAAKRYIPPYHFALAYNGLGKTDETFAWLEKAFQVRDIKLTFLKVEPKWNNLRADPRFNEIIRKIGFQP